MVEPFHHTVQVILVVLGGCLLGNTMLHRTTRGSAARRVTLSLLSLVAVLSVAGYTRFGTFHPYGRGQGNHVYHYPDVYHYFFGAKYFREVGYYKLYEATLIAFDELRTRGVPAPYLANVRDLVGQQQLTPAATVVGRRQSVLARFSPERWSAFKSDLRVMLAAPANAGAWYQMLGDMGFNSPPTWNVTAGIVANAIPFGPIGMELLGFIDMALIIALAGWFVWRAFGAFPLFAYLIVLCNNWIASYDWTGGSFLRQAWLFWSVAGLCSIKLNRYALGGALLGAAAADRIWPGFFLVGAALALGWGWLRHGSQPGPLWRLLGSAAVVFGGLVALSLLMFPAEYWTDFVHKLWQHNNTYFAMHIGFQKLAVFPVSPPGPPAWAGDGYVQWERLLSSYYHQHVVLFAAIKILFVGSALLLSARLAPHAAALVLAATLLFFTSMPANYYYAYLALFAVVFVTEEARETDVLRVLGLFALLIGFLLAPLRWQNILVYNGFINLFVAGYLLLVHTTLLTDLFRPALRRLAANRKAGAPRSSGVAA
jgi:hypothetical protein